MASILSDIKPLCSPGDFIDEPWIVLDICMFRKANTIFNISMGNGLSAQAFLNGVFI